MSTLLDISNLYASAGDKKILRGLNLTVKAGETHVIMGPNGAGKSTLANVILNNPAYVKTRGKITFDGKDITNCSTDEIARAGVFMSFQSPEEIDGVSVINFMRTIRQKLNGRPTFYPDLRREIGRNALTLNMNEELIKRDLNVGFSGGEKKKNEMLQLLVFNPKLAILDETDSGLDVDAIKWVSKGINAYRNDNNAAIIITHNTKILKKLEITHVHVLIDGKIVHTGGPELAKEIEEEGFEKYSACKHAVNN